MSAKLLHAFTDDNPDLQKQIGCMTGIFQIFDRHHIHTGRRITNPRHKRLPAGHLHLNDGSHGMEPNNGHNLQSVTERNPKKNVNENQRVSMESSRVSFSSSSCSSSFSSLDCNKSSQLEFSSFDRAILTSTPLRDPPMNHTNASPQRGRQSLELRDVVKESIYREARALSVKTTTKEVASCTVKHRDSPRPLPLSILVDGSYGVGINGKQRTPADLNESLRVLSKLREAPSYFNEAREPPRSSYEAKDGSSFQVPKDAPRFSYDGREIPRRSFESRDTFKSTTKLRELPRLSLDSREGSMRGSNKNGKSDSILKDLQMNSGNSNDRITNSQQEPGLYRRHPSVIAKLMGLEALPNPISVTDSRAGFVKTSPSRDHEPSVSSKAIDESKNSRVSGSPRSSLKEPISPRLRHPDSVVKPIPSSRCPVEPAPWRQQDGVRGFQKPAFRNRDSPARPPNSSPSVYSEIEKRLKDLEFKQSGKDLRALKQILEAMQAKGLLEAKKEQDQGTNIVSEKDYSPIHTSFAQTPRSTNRSNPQNNHELSDSVKGINSSQVFGSPIVIMKPAKLIEKSGLPASSVIPIDGLSGLCKARNGDSGDNRKGPASRRAAKDLPPKQTPREPENQTSRSSDKKSNGRTLRSMQALSRPQQLPKETNGSPVNNSGSVSPRLHQRRLELEKRSARPPIHSSDASKPRRQTLRQPTESGSPGGKRRPKSPSLKQSDDQSSEISSETRNLSHLGDEISVLSDSNISSGSHMDVEVTSANRSAEINCSVFQQGSQSSPKMVFNKPISSFKQKISSARLSEGGSMEELATVAPEQPSPVSVLDASFDRDDLPSPVKNTSIVFKDDECQNSDDNAGEDRWNPVNLDRLSDSRGSNFSSDINRKKLENIENLVQKLRRLNSNHNEATTDYIGSLCENSNPDHRYISEILLASGLLLRDLSSGLMSIQLHPSGHPINPDLFSVLEQTKASSGILTDKSNSEKSIRSRPTKEKLHRKLVFDAVNEILVRKLTSTGPSSEPWLRANKLAGRTLNAQQLLKELCSELDHQQANNSVCSLDDEEDDSLKSISWEDMMMHQSENWTDFRKEVSGLVLDVERLIFKDLIDEVVTGEAASLRTKPSRRCRQLFAQ